MRQFIGTNQGQDITPMVRDLLLSVSPSRLREAAARLEAAELAMMERDDERTQLRYAAALAEWGEAGGYEAEVHWDACTVAAFGIPYDQCRWRDVGTLSGGEQKRLVLESLLRGTDGVLLLDEPDNYLDVPGKRWLEQQLASTPKTVLLVSHDRELLAACAQRIVTVEDRHVWVHGGGFGNYAQARADRISLLEELRRRWDEEHEKLKELVRTLRQKASYNSDMASRLPGRGDPAAQVRGGRAAAGGPAGTERQDAAAGGRTGQRAVMCENLVLTGTQLVRHRDLVRRPGGDPRGQRVGEVEFPPAARRGAGAARWAGPARRRVVPGFSRDPHPAGPAGRPGRDPDDRARAADQRGHVRAGPVRAAGVCPAAVRHAVRRPAGAAADPAARTGRLDAAAARRADRQPGPAQRRGAAAGPGVHQGTVLAVTHDRWFARSFERFLIFAPDGNVREATEPAWD